MQSLLQHARANAISRLQRDPARRLLYLQAAMADIPRLLGAIDRNPYRPTYGCLDRQYWHYRTADFPSAMYQEGVLPLALVYHYALPGNRWYRHPRVGELVLAGARFTVRACHRDGSCDDYYPFERALGAAVFALAAISRACMLLRIDEPELLRGLVRMARWIASHGESGTLANHHALAALAMVQTSRLTGLADLEQAAERRLRKVLQWQSSDGWFPEYGGADLGYHTVTVDCLAKYRRLCEARWLDEPIQRALSFARWFLHPDGSYAGEYGSRGTYHFYAHGMELCASANADAADLADGFLRALDTARHAHFDDDRLFAHRLGNLIDAYRDWSPTRPRERRSTAFRYFSKAGLLVARSPSHHTVISAARGGVFKHFTGEQLVTDTGLIVETSRGRVATSQWHDLHREIEASGLADAQSLHEGACLTVRARLHWCRFETMTPWKLMLLRVGMCLVGRWFRTPVRRLLQRRMIAAGRPAPIRLTRTFAVLAAENNSGEWSLRVTDLIELLSSRVMVRRMSFTSDHESAYVAASQVYQAGVLAPWTDLDSHVAELNAQRRVTMVREL